MPGPPPSRRIAVVTCDTLTARMAGPAIRAWRIAEALSAEHEVRLVTTSVADVDLGDLDVRSVDEAGLAETGEWCDVLVVQGWAVHGRRHLLDSEKVLVVDVYDPLHLEQLEQGRDDPRSRADVVRRAVAVLNEQMVRGDFFLCASRRQRDFWLGQLSALGRVNTRTYDEDPTMSSLVAIAPFGVPVDPPVRTGPAARGLIHGIGQDDRVILWGGGIYNWFDPSTLLRAVDELRHTHPGVRLLFMGMRHPNPDIPEMRAATEARRLAADLGLTGTHVFFNEAWVPYEERHNYLLDADIGVSTHLDHLETALSWRTRVLDYLWAGVPVVATGGDAMGELLEQRGCGITVPAGDVTALRNALARLLDDPGLRDGMAAAAREAAAEMTWPRALEPLVEFCRAPRRAPDLVDPESSSWLRRDLGELNEGWKGLASDARLGLSYLREGGPRMVASRAVGRIRRVLGEAGDGAREGSPPR